MNDCCVKKAPRIIQNVSEPVVPLRDFAVMQSATNLQGESSGTWTDTTLELTLPEPGTYHLDANARVALTGSTPINIWIGIRLFDVTNNVPVPDSEMLIMQISMTVSPSGTVINTGGNQSGTSSVQYTITGSTVIRLQAQRTNSVGASANARVISDANGRSTLRYERVST